MSGPAALVASDDTWMRRGIATLLKEAGWGCPHFTHTSALLQSAQAGAPRALTVCHLPRALGPMMDTLRSLSVMAARPGAAQTMTVVLTAAPPVWVYDTLTGMLRDGRAGGRLVVLPDTAPHQRLLRAVNGYISPPTEGRRRCPFDVLTLTEVVALADLLVWQLDGRAQAELRGTPPGWQVRLLNGAMRKVGVSSVRSLLFWRPDRPQRVRRDADTRLPCAG